MNPLHEKHKKGFQQKLEGLRFKTKQLQKTIQSYRTVLSGAHIYQNKAENKIRFLWSELHRMNNHCKRLGSQKLISNEEYNEFKIELINQRVFLRTLRAMLPNKTSNLLSFFVGNVTFYMTDLSERIRVKSEYENFKKFFMLFYGGFSVIMLLLHLLNFKSVINLIILPYQLMPVIYYLSLAMRESILKANGSNINTWWTVHHYFSILTSGTICFWNFQSFDQIFGLQYYVFSVYSCISQFLQHLYQMNQLYRMRALGIVNLEDTVNSDSPTINFFFSFKVLLPFLIISHTFQMYLSFYLLKYYFFKEPKTIFSAITGVLFLILAIGNIYSITRVIYDKLHSRSFQSPIRRVSSLSLIMESKIQKPNVDGNENKNNKEDKNDNEKIVNLKKKKISEKKNNLENINLLTTDKLSLKQNKNNETENTTNNDNNNNDNNENNNNDNNNNNNNINNNIKDHNLNNNNNTNKNKKNEKNTKNIEIKTLNKNIINQNKKGPKIISPRKKKKLIEIQHKKDIINKKSIYFKKKVRKVRLRKIRKKSLEK
ncbi:transmembrane protein induced by tumor necrosis factor alpha [Anaeramoeba flamelloides]|uniref:Transmembrane protein induced by tumor necrosis factor alpha n=1 Tax=Anaeramoeba flamelloides TaxID=1746091 RepID=A0AAV8ABK0_9EUKA|nr:transmembrane protein induced by tumor necrosis factor alpha [Anaeramoeba flamelloides]